MLTSKYLHEERGKIRSAALLHFGSAWAKKEVEKWLDKIAQDPDMTLDEKKWESYFFELVVEDCLKQEETIRREHELSNIKPKYNLTGRIVITHGNNDI